MKNFPEEGELVLCTVQKILGTTVFVRLDDFNLTGVIATSEIAPGRIHNIRDYVVINKKIVCKILRVDREKENIDLSLRRVSRKDQKEMLEKYSREKAASAIIEMIAKDKKDEIISEIKKEYKFLHDFLQDLQGNSEIAGKFGLGEYKEKLLEIIKEKIKTKKIKVKAKISLSSIASNGAALIKEALDVPGAEIIYISAPIYTITVESSNYKDANKKIAEIMQKIAENSKNKNVKFEVLK